MTLIRNFTIIYLTYSPPFLSFLPLYAPPSPYTIASSIKPHIKRKISQQKKGTVPRPLDPFILYSLSKYTRLFQHDPMHRLHKIARLLSRFSLS